MTDTTDADWNFPVEAAYWKCQECSYEDHSKSLPSNKVKWLEKGKPAKCKKCKSEAMMPVGW